MTFLEYIGLLAIPSTPLLMHICRKETQRADKEANYSTYQSERINLLIKTLNQHNIDIPY